MAVLDLNNIKLLSQLIYEIILCVDDMCTGSGFNQQTLDKLAWLVDQIRPMVKGLKPCAIEVEDGEWKWKEKINQ